LSAIGGLGWCWAGRLSGWLGTLIAIAHRSVAVSSCLTGTKV
jgi:hypothetical protein